MKNKNEKIIFKRIPECAVFIVYCILHIIVSLKHEHWFDENVAYMIAKYTSVKDILFYVPHYEGHPPLWHLVLKALDCTGLSFETVMIVASTIFTAIAIWLLLMYSPFPKWIKLVLPFTYFLFYQYGIIVRPYCMMMVAFFLMAMTFTNRNKKPWRFVLSMIFLCLTSAYGIIISGGICIAWVVEIVKDAVATWKRSISDEMQGKSKELFVKLLRDGRVKALFTILVVAVLLMIEIMPYPDTHAIHAVVEKRSFLSIINRLTYNFFCVIPDTFCYDVFEKTGSQVVFAAIAGIIIIALIIKTLRKRKLSLYFIIPYILFAMFGSVVYMMSHHTGVINLFFIFILWILFENSTFDINIFEKIYAKITNSISRIYKKELNLNDNDKVSVIKGIKCICYILVIYGLTVSVYYSVWAALHDYKNVYSEGKATAEFIKEHKLDAYKVMADWLIMKDSDGEVTGSYPFISSAVYNVIPYIGRNIYAYHEYGCDGIYDLHVQLSEDEENRIYEKWREIGKPEVIVGDANLSMIFGEIEDNMYSEYVYVFGDKGESNWKDNIQETALGVYVRKDIAEKIGLKEVPKPAVVH